VLLASIAVVNPTAVRKPVRFVALQLDGTGLYLLLGALECLCLSGFASWLVRISRVANLFACLFFRAGDVIIYTEDYVRLLLLLGLVFFLPLFLFAVVARNLLRTHWFEMTARLTRIASFRVPLAIVALNPTWWFRLNGWSGRAPALH
jgi:hypothetical protein